MHVTTECGSKGLSLKDSSHAVATQLDLISGIQSPTPLRGESLAARARATRPRDARDDPLIQPSSHSLPPPEAPAKGTVDAADMMNGGRRPTTSTPILR